MITFCLRCNRKRAMRITRTILYRKIKKHYGYCATCKEQTCRVIPITKQ